MERNDRDCIAEKQKNKRFRQDWHTQNEHLSLKMNCTHFGTKQNNKSHEEKRKQLHST